MSRFAALAVFAVSASTDSLDGWLARKYGWQSRFGAIADPIPDPVPQPGILKNREY